MWFWWFMLCCDILLPVIMILTGRMMWKHSPENINGIVGYRTQRSMKNMDTWKLAHAYSGQLWWKLGWGMLLPFMIVYGKAEHVIGIVSMILMVVQMIVLIGSIQMRGFEDELSLPLPQENSLTTGIGVHHADSLGAGYGGF